jgi:hypothetical protein
MDDSILGAFGRQLAGMLQGQLTATQTKSIVTANDESVCIKCRMAEADGVIPLDQPYSNGMMHPPFHGHTCRCNESTSDELSTSIEVQVTGNTVEVGWRSSDTAKAAIQREFGGGAGPSRPELRQKIDSSIGDLIHTLCDNVFSWLKNRFMR